VSDIETFGESLAGMMIESVADPQNSDQLLLHAWDGRGTTTSRFEYRGKSYISRNRADGIVQSVRFAGPSSAYGSTPKLVFSLRTLLCEYAHLQPDVRDLLVAFILATWFTDCMLVEPILQLFGPNHEVSQVLRLLGCCCRRSVLLAELDLATLASLPCDLNPTLLIHQPAISKRMKSLLCATNQRHFPVFRGRTRLGGYGAKAFYCSGALVSERGLKISLSPSQDPIPFLTDANEEAIARDIQPKLLRYRVVNYDRVRGKNIDCRGFVPEMRDEVHSWLAPVCDCPEVNRVVSQALLGQSRELEGTRFVNPKYIIAEAAFLFCHSLDKQHFFVGELAQTANDMLEGRHEERTVTPKLAGSTLREMGLHGKRCVQGYKITLNNSVRQQIHQLAYSYRVRSVGRVRSCSFCSRELTQRVQ
jgi:hypothetical protein